MALAIKDTKEVIGLALDMFMAGERALADGKISFEDISHLVPIFTVVGPAIEGMGNIGEELKDLSEAEMVELQAFVDMKLGVSNSKWKEVVACAMDLMVAGYKLYMEIKAATSPQAEG